MVLIFVKFPSLLFLNLYTVISFIFIFCVKIMTSELFLAFYLSFSITVIGLLILLLVQNYERNKKMDLLLEKIQHSLNDKE